jgi:hypothetical protein
MGFKADADRAPQRFAPLFERTAGQLLPRPVFTPDGGVVVGRYRFDQVGRFTRFAHFYAPGGEVLTEWMSVLPDGRGIQYAAVGNGPAIVVGSLDRTVQHADARIATLREASQAALSPTGDRVVGLEGDELVVRGLASLAPERRLQVASGTGDPGITGAGDLVFSRLATCGRACGLRRLVRVRPDGAQVTLADSVTSVAITDDTSAAAVSDPKGRIRVIRLDGGEVPSPVPDVVDPSGVTLAVADHGSRVAASTCKRVRVWTFHRGRWAQVLDAPVPGVDPRGEGCFVGSMAFDRDGRRLAVASTTLVVYGEGATPAAEPSLHYAVTPPHGFHEIDTADENEWGDIVPTGVAGVPRELVSFDGHEGAITVHVAAHDAREIGSTQDLTAWAKLAMVRYDHELTWVEDARPAHLRAWIDPAGRRTLEYSRFPRDGCDPKDVYVHIVEDGAVLYRVWVVAPPGEQIVNILPAFFDTPFRTHAPPGSRVAGGGPARGGC